MAKRKHQPKRPTISVHQITDLLAARHCRDVFVPECKSGATQGSTHFRLDAWAIRKSYARPCAWGYEIKAHRSDWLRDQKFGPYLDYCNEFYLVAPAGVIQRDEVPADAGLLEPASTGTRLLTRKRAPYRQVSIPEELYWYVLFTRCRVTREYEPGHQTNYWRAWLAERDAAKRIGHAASRKLRQLIDDRIEAVEDANRQLKAENDALAGVRTMLEDLGVTMDDVRGRYRLKDKLKAACQVVPDELIVALRQTVHQTTATLDVIRELQSQKDPDGQA